MRVLAQAWAPLPLSALALSRGMRGQTRQAVPRSGGVSRLPAWLSRGGGGNEAGLRSASERGRANVPLVQVIYDELGTIRDPLAEAKKGLDSPVLSKVLSMMNELEPSDLGISEEEFVGLSHSLSVPIFITGEGSAAVEMAVFILPAGAELPLHDHPGMAVLSKVLFGSLEVESYDVVGERPRLPSSGARMEEPRLRLEAVCNVRGKAVVDCATPSWLLTPSQGNVHAFRAPTTCAVFDVLVPSYDISRGRKCSYFRVEDTPAPEESEHNSHSRIRGDMDDENSDFDLGYCPTESGQAEAEGKGSGRYDRGAEEGTVDQSGTVRRVLLEEVPEPDGLPRWSAYSGPTIVGRSSSGSRRRSLW